MRHKGFLSSAADACSSRAGPSHLARHNATGPSRRALPPPTPSSSPLPSPPPPPISLLSSTSPLPQSSSSSSSAAAAASSSSSSSSTSSASAPFTSSSLHSRYAFERRARLAKPLSPRLVTNHLSFLYPPSCFAPTSATIARPKSSLAPTSAVASPAAAAQQLALSSQDEHQHQHHHDHQISAQLEPEFTFLRHRYDPPHHLIDHSPSRALLQQDANSHLDDREAVLQQPLPQSLSTLPQSSSRYQASASQLVSLSRQSERLRSSLQDGRATHSDAIVKQCRRLVLQACRITSRLHAKTARAIMYETASDCAFHLAATAQPVAAAIILRHLLVKLGWDPRSNDQLQSLPTLENDTLPALQTGSSTLVTDPSVTPTNRLMLATQQVLSQLTLAPSPFSPRPIRKFDSQQHLDTAASLVSAMHLSQMPRNTASQTALIRAMIASSQTRLAVQMYASEVRAWWAAHKQARRPRPLLRRKAAFVVDLGKPSSQALREITRAMQQLEAFVTRIQPDLLSQLSSREQEALRDKRAEYSDSLVELVRLVRGGRLPLPPTPSAPEIAWVISASCRFEATLMLDRIPVKSAESMPSSVDAAENRRLQGAAQMIRYFLCEYMRSLPDGQTRSAANVLIRGDPVVRPAVGIAVYNRLIHYALSTLRSPSMCKEVFQHMTQLRQPPLEPDAVTFNTILRQATTQRYASLAKAVLTTNHPEQHSHIRPSNQQQSVVIEQSSSMAEVSTSTLEAAACRPDDVSASDLELRPIKPMIQQIDTAIAHADSYRLVALLQYVAASGLFLRRYRHEPGHAGVKELVMRIYPALNKHRSASARFVDSADSAQQHSSLALRPKANQVSRHAILNPHVLTATLNLAAKAGKTGLALRIWRLIKRTSLQSTLQSPNIDVAPAPWQIPVEAATILMTVLAAEAARAPHLRHPARLPRQRPFVRASRNLPQRMTRLTVRRQYARGWNIVASLRGRSCVGQLGSSGRMRVGAGEFGEGLRWRAAQLLAKREYAFLVHHWQLSQRLSSSHRQRMEELVQMGRIGLPAEASPERYNTTGDAEDRSGQGVQPDSRFFDAVLDVFGRRPGMMQRSRKHHSRAAMLSQLRRGYKEATEKVGSPSNSGRMQQQGSHDVGNAIKERRALLAGAVLPIEDPSTLSSTQLLNAIAARIRCNSRGRWTSLSPDPFLLRILIDMQILGIEIPVAYRWILAHASIVSAADAGSDDIGSGLLKNEVAGGSRKELGAFSPFRGPRVKTVGLVARRRNSKVVGEKAEKVEEKRTK
ncbi:hypothetical protein PHSY_002635 [Pseudozyma hubeiensis SY62]|uniref:Uncharacterized protein n=1 Tax=Pseudozyma hubeiensis (strain SY62) TaxID=1305764 RepID=R9PAD2_PSEHS|nr:hypothetical protein PHSY_002635 [Pseudozyma hubeiensis SY62]GAC95060.1 hypothetical protein PHSY_002635 [Pseudozyma hubeiensis SY62]